MTLAHDSDLDGRFGTAGRTGEPVLNRKLERRPWLLPQARRLPGIGPISPEDWLWQLDSYAGQMAERRRLVRERPDDVLALLPAGEAAARELYETVLGQLAERDGYCQSGETMRCPDGFTVTLDPARPLKTLASLIQEDLCLLLRPDDTPEHLLMGAALCFPASWTLAEKIGRPMLAIHGPVAEYNTTLALRVQRLLDGVQPGHPLARCNAFFYDDPALFQPRPERDPRAAGGPQAQYFRSERQCLMRLPNSRAVVFSIHTILMERGSLNAQDLAFLHN